MQLFSLTIEQLYMVVNEKTFLNRCSEGRNLAKLEKDARQDLKETRTVSEV